MTRRRPYFMHDQIRHRERLIMRGHDRQATLAAPVWPLIAAVCALTFLNIIIAMPQP